MQIRQRARVARVLRRRPERQKSIDVVRTKLRGAEARAFAIADNRTAELAEGDAEELLRHGDLGKKWGLGLFEYCERVRLAMGPHESPDSQVVSVARGPGGAG